jgi:hypothetical protein
MHKFQLNEGRRVKKSIMIAHKVWLGIHHGQTRGELVRSKRSPQTVAESFDDGTRRRAKGEISIMNKLMQVGICISVLTTAAAAQTNVTTSGTTSSGTLPVFNGIATVTNSPISISGSNVGIGTATPAATLDVNGSIDLSGVNAIWQDTTNANFAVGYSLLPSTVTPISGTGQGKDNFAVGQGSLSSNTTGSENTAVGLGVLHSTTTSTFNTGLGWMVLHANTTGIWNNGLGGGALEYLTTGNYNNAFGYGALNTLQTGSGNTAFGSEALWFATGNYNSAFGGGANSTGTGRNVTSGSNNSLFGYQAGGAISTGSSNSIFGYLVGGATLTTGSNNILIGTDSSTDVPPCTGSCTNGPPNTQSGTNTSNFLNIGNTIYATNMYNSTNTSGVGYVGIGTSTPSAMFSVGASSQFQVNSSGAISTTGGLAVSAGSVSLPSASISNSALQGSGALTVTAGNGLSGGGAVALGGSTSLSLQTDGVTAGTYGTATQVPEITVDAYGRVTGVTNTSISGISTKLSSLTNPSANLALSTGSYTTAFTAGSTTGTNNLFNFTDTASNTGTGNLVKIATASNSTLKPFAVYAAAGVSPSLQVAQSGSVGIGTATPGANPPSGLSGPFLEVDGNIMLTQQSGGSVIFHDGSIQSTAWNGVLNGGDYAEDMRATGKREKYEPGDVLVLSDGDNTDVQESAEPYSTMVAGIYATRPGVVGRRDAVAKSADNVPMAMVGVVPTKVSAENGPIRKGDLLVTSTLPGYAMKGTDRSRMLGAVLGKAMGSLDSGTGMIEVLVTLQ